jgi:hypothetical protein
METIRAAALVAGVLWMGVTAAAQRQPNFAGTWVLQNTAGNENMAQRLVVEQPVTRWLPRSPAYLTLAVEYHVSERVVGVAHYELNAQGIIEVDHGSGDSRTHFIRRWSTRWQGRVLRIEAHTLPGEFARGYLSYLEHIETWRLDRTGRLIIDRRIYDGRRLDVRTLYYRKQPKAR